MGEIIQLKELEKDDLKETFEEILEWRDDLEDFILIARFKNDTDEMKERFGDVDFRTVHKFFGGNSSINLLGLARHMCDLIAEYIRDNVTRL